MGAAAAFSVYAWNLHQPQLVPIGTLPGRNFEFVSWTGTGNGSYSGKSSEAVITMDSPISEKANYAELYQVTFVEFGLSRGTPWSSTLNQTVMTSNSSEMTFADPNGSYAFTVSLQLGYRTYSGSVTVNGSPVYINVPILHAPPTVNYLPYVISVTSAVIVAAIIAVSLLVRRKKS
ncbi:MAG: hypothetical protein M1163_05995 [Candidatus Thermoplasmatota archaeon]|nr:hypothetical protein [Candidatus Thermoplasmatota archaeon]